MSRGKGMRGNPHHTVVLSLHAIRFPSGKKATDETEPVCSVDGCPSAAPVSESQIRTVLSPEPDAIRFPSGEKATDETGPIRTVLSAEPDAIRFPSGEKATDQTKPVCPVNGCPSVAPVSTQAGRDPLPMREKATDETKPVCPSMAAQARRRFPSPRYPLMIYDAVSQDPQHVKRILAFRFRFCVRLPSLLLFSFPYFPPIAFGGSIPLNLRSTTDNTLYSMLSTVQVNWGLKPLGRVDTVADTLMVQGRPSDPATAIAGKQKRSPLRRRRKEESAVEDSESQQSGAKDGEDDEEYEIEEILDAREGQSEKGSFALSSLVVKRVGNSPVPVLHTHEY
ncbi:hypothetical protein B0H14DRAFT_3444857 [Mycena olivaceomarginata]|nr:hypothetical protein B0H14DRAFT_3444857 [Mycena olivaceomarginata]